MKEWERLYKEINKHLDAVRKNIKDSLERRRIDSKLRAYQRELMERSDKCPHEKCEEGVRENCPCCKRCVQLREYIDAIRIKLEVR